MLQESCQDPEEIGIMGGNVDPYLYVKKRVKGIVHVDLCIDDNLMIGDVEAINNAIAAIKENRLVLKFVECIQDYLSCEVKFLEDKKRAWLRQSHLIKNLVKKFGKQTKNICSQKTTGMFKFLIVRPVVESKKISTDDQHEYWSCLGMLLYLVKLLQPDIANTTR